MAHRILIVDDEETFRESLQRVLQKEGFEVETAASAEHAKEVIAEKVCDVVVSDIILPGASGLECLKICRERNPNLIVIFMTAYATIESAVEAIRAGAYEYIVKPVRHDEFVSLIRKAIQEKAGA